MVELLYRDHVLLEVPSEFEISFNVDVAYAAEDSSTETELKISQQGSSFGSIPVIVRAFTFSRYESFRGSFNSSIGQEAPDLPDQRLDPAAANDDFNSSAQSFVVPDESIEISVPVRSLFVLDDDQAEFTEGFVLFLEVAVGELDPRDRNSITVTNSLVLIKIVDDDRMLITTPLL